MGLIEYSRERRRFIVSRILDFFPENWANEQIGILKQLRSKLGKRRLLG